MLDNILSSVKRGAERVQRRSEEVAQVTRIRMEIFQLARELEGHYARLGRAYHTGGAVSDLQNIREDIRRTEEEVSQRERLLTELSKDGTPKVQPAAGNTEQVDVSRATTVISVKKEPAGE